MSPTLPRGAFACVFLFTAPALAHDLHVTHKPKPSCEMTYEDGAEAARHAQIMHPGSKINEFKGDLAQALMDGINALPPETNGRSQHVLVLTRPDGDDGDVAFGFVDPDGCFIGPGSLSHDQWESISTKALGSPL